MGRERLSITIDPQHDAPAVLKAYAEQFGAGPGWFFLTGKQADIDLLGRKLGLYSAPNPSNKDGRTPSLQWTRAVAMSQPSSLARMIGTWMSISGDVTPPVATFLAGSSIGTRRALTGVSSGRKVTAV